MAGATIARCLSDAIEDAFTPCSLILSEQSVDRKEIENEKRKEKKKLYDYRGSGGFGLRFCTALDGVRPQRFPLARIVCFQVGRERDLVDVFGRVIDEMITKVMSI